MQNKTLTFVLAVVLGLFSEYSVSQPGIEFDLKYTSSVSEIPISGRAILILCNDTLVDPDIPNPMNPFITYGMNFRNWQPGEYITVNESNSDGFMSSMDNLSGYYSIRVLLDLDTSSCILFIDGTCYSDKRIININQGSPNKIDLEVNNVLTGQGFRESDTVRLVKLESKLLTEFYGTPTFIEAAIILPSSYFVNASKYYPVVFVFPGWGATHVSASLGPDQHKRYGMTGFGEEKIFVFLNQDCRYGYHVFADSENNGPRATSFITEFLPYLEEEFRVNRMANGRFLVGQSSGAWAALWLQINYPDMFGMVWAGSPDPVDFRDFVGHNLYAKDANLFYDSNGNLTQSFRTNGKPFSNKEWSDLENALGEGGQYQSFEAVFGKRDVHNKPQQAYDRHTGKIFPEVIEHWKKYDINLILRENSDVLRSKLAGKINIVVADNDDFYLDGSVKLLKKTMDELSYISNINIITETGHSTWSDEIRTRMHRRMDEIIFNK